jgi:hypothetical protein
MTAFRRNVNYRFLGLNTSGRDLDANYDPRVSVPERLLQRLDALAEVLAGRGDAIALIGHGSVGVDLHRLDEHSDLDFFVIVDDGAKQRYLGSIDWLEALHPVAYSFHNTVDGRKVLFEDGLFAEYAVFTVDELARSTFSPGRVVWQRPDAPEGLELPARDPGSHQTPEYHLNEALTNLYVGLHREARGERLSATRFIQCYAVDRVITMRDLEKGQRPQDEFAVERGVEDRFTADELPLAQFVPGYGHNRAAALAILEWLEAHAEVDTVMADAVRALATRSS